MAPEVIRCETMKDLPYTEKVRKEGSSPQSWLVPWVNIAFIPCWDSITCGMGHSIEGDMFFSPAGRRVVIGDHAD
jgi:hypothetical protein